jgi:hypothetical protein
MQIFVAFLPLYLQILPVSAFLKGYNPSTLQNNPQTVFYIPSLLSEKRKIDVSTAFYAFLPEFRIHSISFGYQRVAIAFSYAGSPTVNEKNYSIGTSRRLGDLDAGFSSNLIERTYSFFRDRDIHVNLSISKSASEIVFGAGFLHGLRSREYTSFLFACFKEQWGNTYVDLNLQSDSRTFSVCQDLYILPFINLSFGMSQNPVCYFAGISLRNYIGASFNIRFIENLGYVKSSGIEYTF